jgi:hydroxymethylbilane synthase
MSSQDARPGPIRPGAIRLGAIRLATRGSPLARWQAARVAALLEAGGGPDARGCEVVVVETTGDRLADVPVSRLGGQGAFVVEIQRAVLDGRADIAVHSAKDLPSTTPAGLVLACVPERADPRDALVGSRLADLGPGARVATGSVRRRAQLAWLRPDLTFTELRGNMATRLERAAADGAGVVAVAALQRLGLTDAIAEVLDTGTLLPQVAQGALAVECRADDAEIRALLAGIDDPVAHAAVTAERAFLAEMGGGCTLPVGALATPSGFGAGADRVEPVAPGETAPGGMVLEGLLASRDGRILLRRRLSGPDPAELGRRLASDLLDHGGRVLDDWDLVGDAVPTAGDTSS